MTDAGAVGRPNIAAWQAVINVMELKPGGTILITGGAGLVGQAATAIAHWRGAKPIVADRHKPEGAVDFIDTSAGDLPEASAGTLSIPKGLRGRSAPACAVCAPSFPPVRDARSRATRRGLRRQARRRSTLQADSMIVARTHNFHLCVTRQ